jgi:hypothetical protein
MAPICILLVQFHPPHNSAKVYPNDTCSPSRTNKTRRARHASHGGPTIYDDKKQNTNLNGILFYFSYKSRLDRIYKISSHVKLGHIAGSYILYIKAKVVSVCLFVYV